MAGRKKGTSGDDVFVGSAAKDVVEGGAGNDLLLGKGGDDELNGGDGNDNLVGGDGNDVLNGEAGVDHLDGGRGRDRMSGGTGKDFFTVDNLGDTVIEVPGGGTDTITTALKFFRLPAHVEVLEMTGRGDIGGAGNGANNILSAEFGNNFLDGGAGDDRMRGGLGDDTYVVDSPRDVVTERSGEGVDTVRASISYKLGAQVEKLVLLGTAPVAGTGNAGANTITGNGGRNVLDGGAGRDRLDGAAGADRLFGGAGDDVLVYDRADTRIDGGLGNDTLLLTAPHVALDLVGNTRLAAIERIDLHGGGNSLHLNASTLLRLSDNDTLTVAGTARDSLVADGQWELEGEVVAGYTRYVQGGATLDVALAVASHVLVPNINLAVLTSTQGFRLLGAGSTDFLGKSVAHAGDINGDGFGDIIVGSITADATDGSGRLSGEAYVVFGKASGLRDIDLATLAPAAGFHITGADNNDGAGYSVASAGDVNGDGLDDLLVSSPGADGADNARTDAGEVYVVFGKTSPFDDIDLATMGADEGFRLFGADPLDFCAYEVASAGDVNADGYADLLIGVSRADAENNAKNAAGEAYVVFGKAEAFTDIDLGQWTAGQGFRIFGAAADDHAGVSVSSAGDINGDGIADLVIGSLPTDGEFFVSEAPGQAYVVFGQAAAPGDIDLAHLAAAQGFVIHGVDRRDFAGTSVATAGDLNGDGFDEIIIGAREGDGPANGRKDAGECYVLWGHAGGFADIDLATLTTQQGFRIFGFDEGDRAGQSVSSAGDVNGDGYDDLLIGAPDAIPNVFRTAGRGAAYVIFGRPAAFSDIDLANLPAGQGFRVRGDEFGDQLGFSVSGGGDINGDGFDDLVIGAPNADGAVYGRDRAGESAVIFGRDPLSGVAFAGGANDDTLKGTAAGERLIGAQGDDVIDGRGGIDVMLGGAGDDVLVFDGLDRKVDGGSGVDTLRLATVNQSLDLHGPGLVGHVLEGIEIIDLRGAGDNIVGLTARDVLNLSDSSNSLRIDGDVGDSVISTGQGWIADAGGPVNIQGAQYQGYVLGAASLLVNIDVTVTIS